MTQPPRTLFDSGAQLERTTLAWVRTALALTAIGALLIRVGTNSGLSLLGQVAGALLVAAGVVGGVSATRSYDRRRGRLHAGRPIAVPMLLRCVSAAVGLAAVAATAVAAFP
jgi:uncharacterized membrane protein YidH (DUF202 family)